MYYTKMHGAGNSFLLLENLHGELQGEDLSVLALRLCNCETGPGADGMIIISPVDSSADLSMLFYNADGSMGEMCGNGARCTARYGFEHGLCCDPNNIRILATAGPVTGKRITEEDYEIRLNNPSVIDLHRKAPAAGGVIDCSYIELGSPGIPHAIVRTDEEKLDNPELLRNLAVSLRYSPAFPKGANVTFYSLKSSRCIRAVTYERGVEDFTLACGTGCSAAAVALILSGVIFGDMLDVIMPGGLLHVQLIHDGSSVSGIFLTGPTAVVEEGELPL